MNSTLSEFILVIQKSILQKLKILEKLVNMKKTIQKLQNILSRSLGIGILSLGLGTMVANAQNIANYTFSTTTTGSLASMVGATSMAGSGGIGAGYNDDNTSGVLPMGFTFKFMGNSYTHFSANSNGQMELHINAAATNIGSNVGLQANRATLAPMTGDNSTITGMTYSLTGVAPNRIFVLAFPGFAIPYSSTNPNGDMQVWLYENGKIEYVYGTMQSNGSVTRSTFISSSNTATTVQTVTIGVPPTAAASATLVVNTFPGGNIPGLYSASQGNRRVLTFTPPPIANAAPSNLTFAAVTSNSMTLNWLDNATNESFYIVQRSVDAGVTYTTLATLASNSITYNATGLLPGQLYRFRVIAATENNTDISVAASQSTTPPTTILSSISGGLWKDPFTWAGGVVPTANDSVIIRDGALVTIDTTTATCYALVVGQGTGGTLEFRATPAATLNVGHTVYIKAGGMFTAGGGTLTTHSLTIGGSATTPSPGSIVNNGTLDFFGTAGANITFLGSSNGTITGAGAYDFYRIHLNKGNVLVDQPMLTLNTPYTVEGANTTGAIGTHTAGIFQIGGTFTQSDKVYSTAGYTIPSLGGIWLNNPNFTVIAQSGDATNNGLLRVSQGTYNISTAASAVLSFGSGAQLWVEGGVINHSSRILAANPITFTMTAGIINVATVGNSTSNSSSFGITSASSTINWTGGTVVLNQRSTGGTLNDYSSAPLAGYNGGTLQIGTAATATNFNFYISGNTPKIVIDNTTNNKSVFLRAQTNMRGTFTLPLGSTLNMNGQNLLLITDSIINHGFIDGRTAGSNFVFFGAAAQSVNGTGIDTVQTYANQNTAGGVRFNKPVVTYRVNFFSATTFINSANITLGNGLSQAVVAQIGVAGLTTAAGIFDVVPTMNLGTGTYSLVYAQEGVTRTTSFEIPASRNVFNLTIADTNNVTLAGGNLEVTGTLTLSAGRIVTTTSNLLSVTNTTAGAVSGGSATSYVNGPLQRRLPASLTATSTYAFPVGKGTAYGFFELVNSGTNAGGPVDVLVQRFNVATGGTGDGTTLNTVAAPLYWSVSIPAGAGNLDSTYIRLTSAGMLGINRIGYSSTLTGIYSSASGSPAFGTISSNKLVGSAAVEGFFTVGELIVPISGSFLVGATKVAPNYTTLTAAMADLASKQVQGNVTLLLDADYNSSLETFPISFNQFATNNAAHTVTIAPNTSVSPSIIGNNGTCIIRFTDNAKNYIFNGSNSGTTSRDLFIQNTNTAGAVVMFQGTVANQGVQNTTFKNTVVKGGSNSGSYGIILGGTAVSNTSSGTGHKNLVIENNNVYNCYYAVVISGTSATNKVSGATLLKNEIGTDSATFNNQFVGVYITNADSINISRNIIKNVKTVSSLNVAGVWVESNTTNSIISGNTIKGIYSTSSGGWGAFGLLLNSATGVDNITVRNNAISDILTSNYTLSAQTIYNAYGIRILGGNNLKFYYNTVHLFGQPTTGSSQSSSAAITILTNTMTGFDMRNNIFSNKMTGMIAGSKHYAIATYGAIPGNIFDYNDFIQGSTSQGVLMTAYNTVTFVQSDVPTLAELKTSTAANTNSRNINPQFVNDSNLVIGLGTLQGMGTPIAGITLDIVDSLRSTPPTIGAYEKGVDLVGPEITYIPATNTFLLTNRALTGFATIADPSGLNVTTFKPRIYYRKSTDANAFGTYPGDNTSSFNGWKYAEASNATSPFNFTLNYTLLFGSGTVAVGDTLVYFVTAQDLKTPTFYVSANPSVGFSATDVNTIISGPTTPNRFIIVDAPLAGTYLVGTSQVAPNYTSLTAAVTALNNRGVSAPVIFELTDATYTTPAETFPIVINNVNGGSSTNTVKIRPAAFNTAAITGSSATSMIRFNATSFVKIDGSNNATNSMDLTIQNTNTSGSVLHLGSIATGQVCTNDTIANTRIIGNSTTSTGVYGIFVGSNTIGTAGVENSNITIINDSIYRVGRGIAVKHNAAATGIRIMQNVIGGPGSTNYLYDLGIDISYATSPVITENTICNIISTATRPITAVLVANTTGLNFSKNKVIGIKYIGIDGYAARGLELNGTTNSNTTITNNFFGDLLCDGDGGNSTNAYDYNLHNIIIGGGANHKIQFNSIWITGNRPANTYINATATGLYVMAGATGLDVRNNIFQINQTSSNTSPGAGHGIYSVAPASAFTNLDYNNYFLSSATAGLVGNIGNINATDVTTLAAWKTATGKEANSKNDSVSFVSVSDLHLTGTSIGNVNLVATPIAGLTTDIDNQTRLALYPYMGADENTSSPLPVKLTEFVGVAKADDAILSWTTATEINNAGFDVERSVDGYTFEKAGYVKGAGNSTRTLTYSLTDAKAFAITSSNVIYYRLKQTDFDGKFTYSNVVRVSKTAGEVNALSLFPNPYSTDYSISFTAINDGKASVEMLDIQGKTVASHEADIISGSNTLSMLETASMKPGIYFIRLTVNGETQTLKLVKN